MAQSLSALEVIVVDDGSQDETRDIVRQFGSAVRLIEKANGGPASARNEGARHARGDWLALLDADDWWLPNKLERQMRLATDPNVGIIHALSNNSQRDIPDHLDFDRLWQGNMIANSSVVISREVFEKCGGFDEHPDLLVGEDYNLWLRVAARRYDIVLCRELLVYYRIGLGLSSNPMRFLKGAETSIRLLGAELNLPQERVEARRQLLHETIGRMALHQRDLDMARPTLRAALMHRPSWSLARETAAAHLPRVLLDTRRRLFERGHDRVSWSGDKTSLFVTPEPVAVATPSGRPGLVVIIGASEESIGSHLVKNSVSVAAMAHQEAAQRIFARYGIVPTYAVGPGVATQPDGFKPLRDLLADGACEIGAQINSWTDLSPDEASEVFSERRFPAYLEYLAIESLTRAIEDNLALRPVLYRGGRFGTSRYTARILKWFGYKIDSSIRPFLGAQSHIMPNHSFLSDFPYWCDPEKTLLELPMTVALQGRLAALGPGIFRLVDNDAGCRSSVITALRKTSLLARRRLSPEEFSTAEMTTIARNYLSRDGAPVLVLGYHAASLLPGRTPYVRNPADLSRLFSALEGFLDIFFGKMGGVALTPQSVHDLASGSKAVTNGKSAEIGLVHPIEA